MKVQLPFMTRVLIVVSNVMQDFWFLFLLLPFVLFAVIKLMKQNPGRGIMLMRQSSGYRL